MPVLPYLPFERGTTFDSGSLGSVPVGYLGAKIVLEDGTELKVVKNTDPAVLSGCKLVDYETPQSAAVHEASAAGSVRLAGVVDHEIANKGNTVPVNALFYIVTKGYTHVIAGAVTTVDTGQQSHTTDGTCQDEDDISGAVNATFGIALASANAAASVACLVNFK